MKCEELAIFGKYIESIYEITCQERSHTFKSGGAQAAKITLGPFCPKKWRGPTLLLL